MVNASSTHLNLAEVGATEHLFDCPYGRNRKLYN